MNVFEYLKSRLFDPLAMSALWWEVNPQGLNPGFGLNAKTEDLAKCGIFLLNRSLVGGQAAAVRLVDRRGHRQADRHERRKPSGLASGLRLSLLALVAGGVYRGDGAYGQYCVVMPKQDAVVAITSDDEEMFGSLELMWTILIPAMHDAVEPNAQAQAALEHALAHLEIATPRGEPCGALGMRYSDRIYHLAENGLVVTRLSFHFGTQDAVTLWKEDERLTTEIGSGRWMENATGFEADGLFSLRTTFCRDRACAGAWNGEVDMLKMISPRTPY